MADQFLSMSALRASFGPPVEACILSIKQSNCKPQLLSFPGTDQPRDVRHLQSCSASPQPVFSCASVPGFDDEVMAGVICLTSPVRIARVEARAGDRK